MLKDANMMFILASLDYPTNAVSKIPCSASINRNCKGLVTQTKALSQVSLSISRL